MDIAALIDSFATGTYTVTRKALGTVVRGRQQDGASSSLTITASVSPASDDDLQRLPEGMRLRESRVLFTTTELKVGGQGAAYSPDLVSIDGLSWEVSAVATWKDSMTRDVGYRYIVTATANV